MSQRILSFCLVFLNFLHQTVTSTRNSLEKMVNNCLHKKVVYYALYSKHDNHYACLYDCRSFWDRLWLVFQRLLISLKLDEDTVFSYDDVDDNFECMSSHFIDVAIIVYIEDGVLKEKMFMQNTTKKSIVPTNNNFKYIYCVVEDDQERTLDLTSSFNVFKQNINQNKILLCKDFVKLFVCYKNYTFNVDRMICLKMMPDDTFDEVVFKDNDVIHHV
jgi:hypothetical protein